MTTLGPRSARASAAVLIAAASVAPAVEIHQVQGSGARSPFAGQQVTVTSVVVTAVGPDLFVVQTPAGREDSDPETSEGLVVYTGRMPQVSVGNLVDVTGEVQEFYGLTELAGSLDVVVISDLVELPPAIRFGDQIPSPDPVRPTCAVGRLECLEGMRVRIDPGRVIGPSQSFSSDPVAEAFVVASGELPMREPGIPYPGVDGLPVWDGNPEILELDPDRLGLDNVELFRFTSFRAEGVLAWEFGDWELWPTVLGVGDWLRWPSTPAAGDGEVAIASLNLKRLLPAADLAGGQEEYRRRIAKLASYIRDRMHGPAVLAVQEAGEVQVLRDLAARIAVEDGAVRYTPFLLEGNDPSGIDVGLMVRDGLTVEALRQVDAAATLSLDGSPLHDRPPLIAELTVAGDPALAVVVVVLHLRSLNDIDDPSKGPWVRQKRLEQAQSVARAVQSLQTGQPSRPVVVIGDFNGFELSDGWVDVVAEIAGRPDSTASLLSGPDLVEPDLELATLGVAPWMRYSFVLRGTAEAIDHALLSRSAAQRVRAVGYARGNADFPEVMADDEQTALRASDHDGLVVVLRTTTSPAPRRAAGRLQ